VNFPPAAGYRLTRSGPELELYFPPLRAPAAAGSIALFGCACLAPGVFAALAVAPASSAGAAGMLGIWLMSIFILPFVAFGMAFLALAAYLLANSLTVSVTATEIRSLRRVFGLALAERRIACCDIARLTEVATLRNRWPGAKDVYYSLVATSRSGKRRVTVAETLSRAALAEASAEIARAGRLAHAMMEQGGEEAAR
jgi:hypothetical protein